MNWETIKKNRWHLHALTFVFALIGCWLIERYNFLHLKDAGNVMSVIAIIAGSYGAAFFIEWLQGALFGANRTPSERKASWQDILVSVVAGAAGALIGVMIF